MYQGPIVVTVVYLLVYYAFQMNQLRVKTKLRKEYKARGEKFDRYFGNDRVMLAADRYVLNTLEHMPPFLVLLWVTAVFAGTAHATIPGAVYVFSRLVYPFLMGNELGGNVPNRIMYTTFVGYGVITYFAVLSSLAAFGVVHP